MNYIPNTPEGTRDRMLGECRELRQVQSALTKLYRRRGYSEIMTPEVEFYDVFCRGGCALPQESMLKIIDRSGKILVLRPEGTTPIARVAATKLKDTILPRRFYYNETVYRSSTENKDERGELTQCGVELIGAAGMKADLEVIAAAVDSLRVCGVENFHIELGHAGIFGAFAEGMHLNEDELEQVRTLIEGKSFAALNDFLKDYRHQPGARAMNRLAYLFGGPEVLDEAEALLGKGSATLDYLRELYAMLVAAGYGDYIRFDLGMVHRLNFYTGVIFRGYVQGAGEEVLSGGRYDNLVAAFGRPAQATGFTVNVDVVAGCLPRVELPAVDTVIHYEPALLAKALALVDSLPEGSCELSPSSRLEGTMNLAREKGIRRVIILDEDGQREVEA
ncbi:MAG: ATP phosphoribosyltransferase regulatory subunit [Clostridiales bacterium]|nr:ATP phosphoribosyltransferase regulatory subunit [Clostridiales bacterium]